jgi:N-acetylglutamate synthase-like GNAT family acetyltransferase
MENPRGTPALDEFLYGPRRNVWLEGDYMRVYVRRGFHALDGSRVGECLDIANINVEPQGNGIFTAWLTYAEYMAKERSLQAVFVENILTQRLIDFLRRHGYVKQPSNPSSMYKFL